MTNQGTLVIILDTDFGTFVFGGCLFFAALIQMGHAYIIMAVLCGSEEVLLIIGFSCNFIFT